MAIAAPAIPHLNIAINNQSSTIFSTPPSIDIHSPKCAFPTVIYDIDNIIPNTVNGIAIKIGYIYSIQYVIKLSSEPSNLKSGFKNTKHKTDITKLTTNDVKSNSEKSSRASCFLPSPIFFATNALPPLPNIVPIPVAINTIGITILTADSASVLTSLATNSPSTVV